MRKRHAKNPSPLMIVSSNPRGRRRRRRSGSRGGFNMKSFKPNVANLKGMAVGAAQGAAGALAVNAAVRFLPLPEMLVSGRAIYATRFALAIGVGMLASHVNSRLGMRMTEGALTVLAVDVIRDAVRTTTGYELGGVSYFSPARVLPRSIAGARGVGKQLTSAGSAGKYLALAAVNGQANRSAVNSGYRQARYGYRS